MTSVVQGLEIYLKYFEKKNYKISINFQPTFARATYARAKNKSSWLSTKWESQKLDYLMSRYGSKRPSLAITGHHGPSVLPSVVDSVLDSVDTTLDFNQVNS